MDFFLKFLILGGKYLTKITAQSIIEAYKRSVRLRQTLSSKFEKSFRMTGHYENILELYNENLDEISRNAQMQMAFISDAHRMEFEAYLKQIEDEGYLKQLKRAADGDMFVRKNNVVEEQFSKIEEEMKRDSMMVKKSNLPTPRQINAKVMENKSNFITKKPLEKIVASSSNVNITQNKPLNEAANVKPQTVAPVKAPQETVTNLKTQNLKLPVGTNPDAQPPHDSIFKIKPQSYPPRMPDVAGMKKQGTEYKKANDPVIDNTNIIEYKKSTVLRTSQELPQHMPNDNKSNHTIIESNRPPVPDGQDTSKFTIILSRKPETDHELLTRQERELQEKQEMFKKYIMNKKPRLYTSKIKPERTPSLIKSIYMKQKKPKAAYDIKPVTSGEKVKPKARSPLKNVSRWAAMFDANESNDVPCLVFKGKGGKPKDVINLRTKSMRPFKVYGAPNADAKKLDVPESAVRPTLVLTPDPAYYGLKKQSPKPENTEPLEKMDVDVVKQRDETKYRQEWPRIPLQDTGDQLFPDPEPPFLRKRLSGNWNRFGYTELVQRNSGGTLEYFDSKKKFESFLPITTKQPTNVDNAPWLLKNLEGFLAFESRLRAEEFDKKLLLLDNSGRDLTKASEVFAEFEESLWDRQTKKQLQDVQMEGWRLSKSLEAFDKLEKSLDQKSTDTFADFAHRQAQSNLEENMLMRESQEAFDALDKKSELAMMEIRQDYYDEFDDVMLIVHEKRRAEAEKNRQIWGEIEKAKKGQQLFNKLEIQAYKKLNEFERMAEAYKKQGQEIFEELERIKKSKEVFEKMEMQMYRRDELAKKQQENVEIQNMLGERDKKTYKAQQDQDQPGEETHMYGKTNREMFDELQRRNKNMGVFEEMEMRMFKWDELAKKKQDHIKIQKLFGELELKTSKNQQDKLTCMPNSEVKNAYVKTNREMFDDMQKIHKDKGVFEEMEMKMYKRGEELVKRKHDNMGIRKLFELESKTSKDQLASMPKRKEKNMFGKTNREMFDEMQRINNKNQEVFEEMEMKLHKRDKLVKKKKGLQKLFSELEKKTYKNQQDQLTAKTTSEEKNMFVKTNREMVDELQKINTKNQEVFDEMEMKMFKRNELMKKKQDNMEIQKLFGEIDRKSYKNQQDQLNSKEKNAYVKTNREMFDELQGINKNQEVFMEIEKKMYKQDNFEKLLGELDEKPYQNQEDQLTCITCEENNMYMKSNREMFDELQKINKYQEMFENIEMKRYKRDELITKKHDDEKFFGELETKTYENAQDQLTDAADNEEKTMYGKTDTEIFDDEQRINKNQEVFEEMEMKMYTRDELTKKKHDNMEIQKLFDELEKKTYKQQEELMGTTNGEDENVYGKTNREMFDEMQRINKNQEVFDEVERSMNSEVLSDVKEKEIKISLKKVQAEGLRLQMSQTAFEELEVFLNPKLVEDVKMKNPREGFDELVVNAEAQRLDKSHKVFEELEMILNSKVLQDKLKRIDDIWPSVTARASNFKKSPNALVFGRFCENPELLAMEPFDYDVLKVLEILEERAGHINSLDNANMQKMREYITWKQRNMERYESIYNFIHESVQDSDYLGNREQMQAVKREVDSMCALLEINDAECKKMLRNLTHKLLDLKQEPEKPPPTANLVPLFLECKFKLNEEELKERANLIDVNEKVFSEVEDNIRVVKLIDNKKLIAEAPMVRDEKNKIASTNIPKSPKSNPDNDASRKYTTDMRNNPHNLPCCVVKKVDAIVPVEKQSDELITYADAGTRVNKLTTPILDVPGTLMVYDNNCWCNKKALMTLSEPANQDAPANEPESLGYVVTVASSTTVQKSVEFQGILKQEENLHVKKNVQAKQRSLSKLMKKPKMFRKEYESKSTHEFQRMPNSQTQQIVAKKRSQANIKMAPKKPKLEPASKSRDKLIAQGARNYSQKPPVELPTKSNDAKKSEAEETQRLDFDSIIAEIVEHMNYTTEDTKVPPFRPEEVADVTESIYENEMFKDSESRPSMEIVKTRDEKKRESKMKNDASELEEHTIERPVFGIIEDNSEVDDNLYFSVSKDEIEVEVKDLCFEKPPWESSDVNLLQMHAELADDCTMGNTESISEIYTKIRSAEDCALIDESQKIFERCESEHFAKPKIEKRMHSAIPIKLKVDPKRKFESENEESSIAESVEIINALENMKNTKLHMQQERHHADHEPKQSVKTLARNFESEPPNKVNKTERNNNKGNVRDTSMGRDEDAKPKKKAEAETKTVADLTPSERKIHELANALESNTPSKESAKPRQNPEPSKETGGIKQLKPPPMKQQTANEPNKLEEDTRRNFTCRSESKKNKDESQGKKTTADKKFSWDMKQPRKDLKKQKTEIISSTPHIKEDYDAAKQSPRSYRRQKTEIPRDANRMEVSRFSQSDSKVRQNNKPIPAEEKDQRPQKRKLAAVVPTKEVPGELADTQQESVNRPPTPTRRYNIKTTEEQVNKVSESHSKVKTEFRNVNVKVSELTADDVPSRLTETKKHRVQEDIKLVVTTEPAESREKAKNVKNSSAEAESAENAPRLMLKSELKAMDRAALIKTLIETNPANRIWNKVGLAVEEKGKEIEKKLANMKNNVSARMEEEVKVEKEELEIKGVHLGKEGDLPKQRKDEPKQEGELRIDGEKLAVERKLKDEPKANDRFPKQEGPLKIEGHKLGTEGSLKIEGEKLAMERKVKDEPTQEALKAKYSEWWLKQEVPPTIEPEKLLPMERKLTDEPKQSTKANDYERLEKEEDSLRIEGEKLAIERKLKEEPKQGSKAENSEWWLKQEGAEKRPMERKLNDEPKQSPKANEYERSPKQDDSLRIEGEKLPMERKLKDEPKQGSIVREYERLLKQEGAMERKPKDEPKQGKNYERLLKQEAPLRIDGEKLAMERKLKDKLNQGSVAKDLLKQEGSLKREGEKISMQRKPKDEPKQSSIAKDYERLLNLDASLRIEGEKLAKEGPLKIEGEKLAMERKPRGEPDQGSKAKQEASEMEAEKLAMDRKPKDEPKQASKEIDCERLLKQLKIEGEKLAMQAGSLRMESEKLALERKLKDGPKQNYEQDVPLRIEGEKLAKEGSLKIEGEKLSIERKLKDELRTKEDLAREQEEGLLKLEYERADAPEKVANSLKKDNSSKPKENPMINLDHEKKEKLCKQVLTEFNVTFDEVKPDKVCTLNVTHVFNSVLNNVENVDHSDRSSSARATVDVKSKAETDDEQILAAGKPGDPIGKPPGSDIPEVEKAKKEHELKKTISRKPVETGTAKPENVESEMFENYQSEAEKIRKLELDEPPEKVKEPPAKPKGKLSPKSVVDDDSFEKKLAIIQREINANIDKLEAFKQQFSPKVERDVTNPEVESDKNEQKDAANRPMMEKIDSVFEPGMIEVVDVGSKSSVSNAPQTKKTKERTSKHKEGKIDSDQKNEHKDAGNRSIIEKIDSVIEEEAMLEAVDKANKSNISGAVEMKKIKEPTEKSEQKENKFKKAEEKINEEKRSKILHMDNQAKSELLIQQKQTDAVKPNTKTDGLTSNLEKHREYIEKVKLNLNRNNTFQTVQTETPNVKKIVFMEEPISIENGNLEGLARELLDHEEFIKLHGADVGDVKVITYNPQKEGDKPIAEPAASLKDEPEPKEPVKRQVGFINNMQHGTDYNGPIRIFKNSIWSWEANQKKIISQQHMYGKDGLQYTRVKKAKEAVKEVKKYKYERKEIKSALGKAVTVTYLVEE